MLNYFVGISDISVCKDYIVKFVTSLALLFTKLSVWFEEVFDEVREYN